MLKLIVKTVHLTVREEVVEVLKETMEEVQLVETSSVVVMDRCESSLAVFIKEQMEAEYVQLTESKCDYASSYYKLFRE